MPLLPGSPRFVDLQVFASRRKRERLMAVHRLRRGPANGKKVRKPAEAKAIVVLQKARVCD